MGTNGNSFYSKQQINNNNAFMFMEDQSLSTTTATSPFPQTFLTSTNITTTPIHRVYSAGLVEEPTSTTGEVPEEWNSTNQSLGLDDLRVHELKTECKKRGLAVSGSKQALIDRLQPFEHSIILQQQRESLLIFNEGIVLKKKKKNVNNGVVVDSSPALFSSNSSCLGEKVVAAVVPLLLLLMRLVIDSVIDGRNGFTEGTTNLKNNLKLKNNNKNINKQKRIGRTNNKSNMFFSKSWKPMFLGNFNKNVGCKCCSCGHKNNVYLNNKNMENIEIRGNNEQQCLLEEEKRVEEVGEDKIVDELKEVGEEEEGKEEEEREDVDEKQNFTPLEPADISIVISEENKTCCKEEKQLDKEQQKQQQNNSKTFLEPPQTLIKQNKFSTNKCCNYQQQLCCCSPFQMLSSHSSPCSDVCCSDVCVPSFNKNNVVGEEIIPEQQQKQLNEQNMFQQKHQQQQLPLVSIRENENNINNTINCCCCLQNQQQCFVGNEQLLSAATLSKHEELLRQQQQKIAELQKELTRSQIGLQKHQQIEQQLTLERQINGQKALVCAEQKLQEELHTEQAVQDICRLIGQESKTALLIVQLLRRYQLEHNSSVLNSNTATTNQTNQQPLLNYSPNNNLLLQHSEHSLNIQEEQNLVETTTTKTKRKVGKHSNKEKHQNINNTTMFKRKGGGRSKSALEGLISNEHTKDVFKRSSCECFDNNNINNQKRPNSSLGAINSGSTFDMEEIFRSVLEGTNSNNNSNNSPQPTTTPINNQNIYLAESQLLIEEQRQQQSFEHIIHSQEMEKTMQDLMEVLQNDQSTTTTTNCINNSQTDRLANFLAEEVEMHRNNSSNIFSSSFTASTNLFHELNNNNNNTPQQQQPSFTTEIAQNEENTLFLMRKMKGQSTG
uniref:SAP domain-containing protein n=1 Tax=Meloidogyne enterolobii TaxID=390850 RepID=A0A6V7WDK1_MELEN|nr:unnamed protein product [Meloidogyne enterolobii]